jgi:hypothetical protein
MKGRDGVGEIVMRERGFSPSPVPSPVKGEGSFHKRTEERLPRGIWRLNVPLTLTLSLVGERETEECGLYRPLAMTTTHYLLFFFLLGYFFFTL